MKIEIFENKFLGSRFIAHQIACVIKDKQSKNQSAVLGLATGATPTEVYEELVRMHRQEGLDFKNVITFNLDEYYPMQPHSQYSYSRFMHHYLFDHINIITDNIHIPDGSIPREEIEDYCRAYEEKICSVGGIDIQLLGIGRTGHIGFNEPLANPDSQTRLVKLHAITRQDAVKDFDYEEQVPLEAITMGIRTILQARKIIVAGWGAAKANIIRMAIEDNVTQTIPATYLQNVASVKWVLDKYAASALSVQLNNYNQPAFYELNY